MESEQPNQRERWDDANAGTTDDERLTQRMRLIVEHANNTCLTLDQAAKEYVKAQKILTDGEDE